MSLAGGILIALCGTFILSQSYLWACLITVGLAVAVLSLTAKDFKNYWLAVFALALPLDIKKLLIDSDYIREVVLLNSAPLGELPGPVLYLSDLPFLVLLIFWLYEIIYKKQKVFFPKSNWFALAFLAWSALSLINAPMLSYGFFDLIRMFKFYLLYLYIANNVRNGSSARTLINFLFIGLIFQGLICLYQFITQDISHIFGNLFGAQDLYSEEAVSRFAEYFAVSPGSDIRRASGTVGSHNGQAQYFELLLPIALLLWFTATKFRHIALNFSSFALGLLGLIVTFSRGGGVGLSAGILSALLLAKILRVISNRKFMLAIMLALCASVVLAPKFYHFLASRPEASMARFHLDKVGIDMIRDHPILGVGLNNHLNVKPDYDPESYEFPTPVHNHYIFVASEVGIPGLVFFLGLLIQSCVLAFKAARLSDVYSAALAIGILGAFVAISTHNLADHLNYQANLTLLWLYAGLAASLENTQRNACREECST